MKYKAVLGTSTSLLALAAGATDANAGEAFDGMYIGLGLSGASGVTADGSTSPDYSFTGGLGGVFVGGNVVTDSGLVFGIEGAISMGALVDGDSYETSQLIDVKLKLGQTFGSSMIYGFGGMTTGRVTDYDDDVNYAASGVLFGIGYEKMLNDRFSIGAEIGHRVLNVSDDYETGSHTFVTVRGVIRF